MDATIYKPEVAFRIKARNVVQVTPETPENPATYSLTVKPIDVTELGASPIQVAIGDYVMDFVGTPYRITNVALPKITVSDDFRSGACPTSGQTAIIYRSVGDGNSPYLSPIYYRFLDKQALANSKRFELDILWENLLHTSAIEDTKGITGFVNASDIDCSYNHANRTITLTGVLDYYWRGRKKTLVSPWTSPVHAATVGKWFLSSNDGENFVWRNTIWSFADVMVAMVNYKATAAETFAISETHGTMDSEAHEEDHDINGTYLLSGGKATAGTFTLNTATDAANSPGFDQAVLKDEDLRTTIPAWIEGTYTTLRIGASGDDIFNIAASLPFITAGSYIQVNNPFTGSMTNGINNRFYNVYKILIPVTSDAPSQKFRMVFLQPQKTFIDQVTAESEDVNGLLLGDLDTLTAEFKVYSRLTYKTLAGDLNTGKCRLASITYVVGTRSNSLNVGGIVPTNHAALSNLPWTTGGHTGTAGKLAGFGVSGEAVEVDVISLGYLEYTVLVTQTGTSAPTVIVLKNTIGAVVLSRTAAGTYSLTLSGAFVSDKTTPVDDIMMDQAGNIYTLNRISADVMELKTYAAANLAVAADNILNKRYINISVFA